MGQAPSRENVLQVGAGSAVSCFRIWLVAPAAAKAYSSGLVAEHSRISMLAKISGFGIASPTVSVVRRYAACSETVRMPARWTLPGAPIRSLR
jgi:hypothetical protein